MSTHWNLGKPTGSSFPPLEVMSLYENWPKHLNTKCKPPPIDSLASLTMDMRNKLPNFYFKDITVTWLDSDGGLRVLSTFRDKRILNTLYVDGRFEKPFGEIGFRSFHLKMWLKFTPAGNGAWNFSQSVLDKLILTRYKAPGSLPSHRN